VRSVQIRYLLAGGTAAAANFGSRLVFSRWVNYEAAILLAFVVGLTVGFSLMRGYVFDAQHKPLAPQLGMFVAVNLLAVLQTLAVSLVLARWALPAIGAGAYAESIGHLGGIAAPVVTSYFAHRFVTFR
jgi:putative flippase GtrA